MSKRVGHILNGTSYKKGEVYVFPEHNCVTLVKGIFFKKSLILKVKDVIFYTILKEEGFVMDIGMTYAHPKTKKQESVVFTIDIDQGNAFTNIFQSKSKESILANANNDWFYLITIKNNKKISCWFTK